MPQPCAWPPEPTNETPLLALMHDSDEVARHATILLQAALALAGRHPEGRGTFQVVVTGTRGRVTLPYLFELPGPVPRRAVLTSHAGPFSPSDLRRLSEWAARVRAWDPAVRFQLAADHRSRVAADAVLAWRPSDSGSRPTRRGA